MLCFAAVAGGLSFGIADRDAAMDERSEGRHEFYQVLAYRMA